MHSLANVKPTRQRRCASPFTISRILKFVTVTDGLYFRHWTHSLRWKESFISSREHPYSIFFRIFFIGTVQVMLKISQSFFFVFKTTSVTVQVIAFLTGINSMSIATASSNTTLFTFVTTTIRKMMPKTNAAAMSCMLRITLIITTLWLAYKMHRCFLGRCRHGCVPRLNVNKTYWFLNWALLFRWKLDAYIIQVLYRE